MIVIANFFGTRPAKAFRLTGLAALIYWQFRATHPAGFHGRGLVILVVLACAAVAWAVWAWNLDREGPVRDGGRPSWDLLILGASGGLLVAASNDGPGNVFIFVAAFASGARHALPRSLAVTAAAIVAVCLGWVLYGDGGLGELAYAFGLIATTLGGSQRHEALVRREQAELLLAQTQRSHEEQLRAAKLTESSRIAREIHDVLAHSLAGLTIQLEATAALIEGGADAETILPRVRHAHELAREGLRETRLAVGALREGGAAVVPAAARIEALVSDFRATGHPVDLSLIGERERLSGPAGDATVRILQEALTNVAKHAPGAAVRIQVDAGPDLVLCVENAGGVDGSAVRAELAHSGGGYGIAGMGERARELGGRLEAGPTATGWRVHAEIPAQAGPPIGTELATEAGS